MSLTKESCDVCHDFDVVYKVANFASCQNIHQAML